MLEQTGLTRGLDVCDDGQGLLSRLRVDGLEALDRDLVSADRAQRRHVLGLRRGPRHPNEAVGVGERRGIWDAWQRSPQLEGLLHGTPPLLPALPPSR